MSAMVRAAAVLAALLCVTVGLSADVQKYGKPLTLKETTKISDIYANPDKYKDKRVRVEGPILDVCAEQGCWIAIGGDKDAQSLRFKVDDGVIVFPVSIKGLKATVEGVISVAMLSEADQIAQGMELAKEKKTTFDPVGEDWLTIAIRVRRRVQ
jgi:hypothetical protein